MLFISMVSISWPFSFLSRRLYTIIVFWPLFLSSPYYYGAWSLRPLPTRRYCAFPCAHKFSLLKLNCSNDSQWRHLSLYISSCATLVTDIFLLLRSLRRFKFPLFNYVMCPHISVAYSPKTNKLMVDSEIKPLCILHLFSEFNHVY